MNEGLFNKNKNPISSIPLNPPMIKNEPQIIRLYNVDQSQYQPVANTVMPISDAALTPRTSLPNQNEVLLQSQNQYIPPNIAIGYNQFDSPKRSNANLNEINLLNNKLIFLDNRLSSFEYFLQLLYVMLILSIFAIFYSIYYLSKEDEKFHKAERRLEIFNFVINISYILGYILGIQAFFKQDKKKSKLFHYLIMGFCGVGCLYFIIYLFIHATFFTWCSNTFYLVMNVVLYYQIEEYIKLIDEKSELKRRYDNIRI